MLLPCTQTLAFLVPLLAAIGPEDGLSVIIATPSQELAVQIAAEAERLHPDAGNGSGRRSSVLLAISSSRETELEQQDALLASARVPQVLVGTPQRLADLARHPRARPILRSVRSLVFDEVDLMLPPLPAPPPGAQWRGSGAAGNKFGGAARGRAAGRALGRGRGGRGRGGRGANGESAEGPKAFGAIERRLARKRPAELLMGRVLRARPRSAAPLQLVSCSATITADLRRQIASIIGGEGKRAAGIVVTTDLRTQHQRRLRGWAWAG